MAARRSHNLKEWRKVIFFKSKPKVTIPIRLTKLDKMFKRKDLPKLYFKTYWDFNEGEMLVKFKVKRMSAAFLKKLGRMKPW